MLQYIPFETIKLGPIPIQVWGLFVVLGFGAGILFSYFRAKKIYSESVSSGVEKRSREITEHIFNLGFWALLGGIVGSRVMFIFYDFKYFLENPLNIFKVWHGGMAIYGGVLLAMLFCYLYIRKHKLNFWQLSDLLAPGLALGLVVGRIGCFLIHDHIGYVMKILRFWGINYFGEIRHEIALYLILSNFLLFLALLILQKFIKKQGQLFLVFLLWYSIARLLIDSLRDFEVRYYNLMISQWIAIVVIIVAIIYLFKRQRAKNN